MDSRLAFELRPIREDDAEGINAIRRMEGVMENILGIPSETLKKSQQFIASIDSNNHQFVAVLREHGEEKIIGTAGLAVSQSPRLRHSAGIGIMVHRDYQGMGVGRALMNKLLDLADNWLMLVRVELGVFTDNKKAINLYESLGFLGSRM